MQQQRPPGYCCQDNCRGVSTGALKVSCQKILQNAQQTVNKFTEKQC